MSGVLVIEQNEHGRWFIMAKDQEHRPSQQMVVSDDLELRAIRTKAAVLGQILGVEVIDTTR